MDNFGHGATGTDKRARGCLIVIIAVGLSLWTVLWVGGNFDFLSTSGEPLAKQKIAPSSNMTSPGLAANSMAIPLSDSSLEQNMGPPAVVPSASASKKLGDNFPETDSYDIGVEYLFWRGKNLICGLIRNVTGVSTLGTDEPDYIQRGRPPPLLNLTLRCEELTSSMGNWITGWYHLRLVAAMGRVDLQFQCSTGMELAGKSILPWLTGRYPAPASYQEWPYDFGWPTEGRVCTRIYAKLPLHHLAHEIRRDMQRIAIAMLGLRLFDVADKVTDDLKPLQELLRERPDSEVIYPREDVVLDDAAIHFRCGDVFGGTTKDVYGLIKFREYVKRIPRLGTRKIGIHTQSFNASLLRGADRAQANDCKKVVHLLFDYLQASYPNATITIRNTPEDSIPLAYARMIMAKQTITTMSTFGIFPAIGSFGDGYFQKSGRQNRFAQQIPEVLPSFHEMDGPILSSPKIAVSKWDDIVHFLTEQARLL